jgi:hypothetical protein
VSTSFMDFKVLPHTGRPKCQAKILQLPEFEDPVW